MNMDAAFEAFASKFEREELAEAEAAGVTVEQLRAKLEAESAEREKQREDERKRSLRASRLAPMAGHMRDDAFAAVVHDRLRARPALEFVQGWLRADNRAPLALLTGNTGCGKTVAAAWGMCRSPNAEYVHARNLGARYMPYSHDQARGMEPLDLCTGLLILDDVGTERRTGSPPKDRAADERFTEAFSMILEMRQSSNTPTIITTNKAPDAFVETYCQDPRDRSRFDSMTVICRGGREDMRK